MAFELISRVSWAHLDANGHMANTAYLNIAVDARFSYFSSCGMPPAEFAKLRIGPVVRHDEVEYFKELHLLQTLKVNFLLAGLSEDGSRFRIRNEIRRDDDVLAAKITTLGGWFDLNARKLIAPPDKLAEALRSLPHSDDYQALESSLKSQPS